MIGKALGRVRKKVRVVAQVRPWRNPECQKLLVAR